MVTAAAPAHLATEVHATLALGHPAERRNTAAGRGIRVGAPDLLLQLRREQRQLMAVGTQQTHGPGGAGATAGEQGDAVGEFGQRQFQATECLGLEGAVQADAFEQRDILIRHLAQLFGTAGVRGNGRQKRLEVFEERVWLFHGRPCLLLEVRQALRIVERRGMQGQYRTACAGTTCTFGRQGCTFHRHGRHRHKTWQAQSSRVPARWLTSGFLL